MLYKFHLRYMVVKKHFFFKIYNIQILSHFEVLTCATLIKLVVGISAPFQWGEYEILKTGWPCPYLHVRSLCLRDGAIKVSTGSKAACQALIYVTQLLCQHTDIMLQTSFLGFLLLDQPVQLFSFRTQFLYAWERQGGWNGTVPKIN